LLMGGIPGVVIGCLFSKRVPARKLKYVIAGIAIFAGLQLVYTGARAAFPSRSHHAVDSAPRTLSLSSRVRCGIGPARAGIVTNDPIRIVFWGADEGSALCFS
jgi:uncharacterized membrane protein YfcA